MTAIKRTKLAARNGAALRSTRGSSGAADSLLNRYRRTGSAKLLTELVERYGGIVESMARALAARLPRSVDAQDLAHAGMWGLLQAIENWRPERGSHFVPFMRMRVRGAMLDELRTMDFLPRVLRRHQRAVDAAQERLRESLARDPSDGELADALGMSESRLRQACTAARPLTEAPPRRRTDGADGADGDDHGNPIDRLADDDVESPIDALQRSDLLTKIRESLQPIEWRVLQLHYLEGMSGKDIARKLKLSASRICQIHGRVLERLKSRLG